MKKRFNVKGYFTKGEIALWVCSVALILGSFLIFRGQSLWNVLASLLGVTSLIFIAKGNPVGQALMIVFCAMYGIISYSFRYWGEMLTYLLVSLPMSAMSLISWCKNPYKGKKSEVTVRQIGKKEIALTCLLAVAVTAVFYFILRALNTANLIVSTVSVTTSFAAACLLYLRSPYYALAYAANDVVLIVLWVLASVKDTQYVSVVACFLAFLANDTHGFISWRAMERRQGRGE